mmetsp:Transcript_25838/g.62750  ORF Transcript_25838/g.62750 Transcript_25838/m.62750 type:complete len:209 (+) Transcript_25838:1060-1686(+)
MIAGQKKRKNMKPPRHVYLADGKRSTTLACKNLASARKAAGAPETTPVMASKKRALHWRNIVALCAKFSASDSFRSSTSRLSLLAPSSATSEHSAPSKYFLPFTLVYSLISLVAALLLRNSVPGVCVCASSATMPRSHAATHTPYASRTRTVDRISTLSSSLPRPTTLLSAVINPSDGASEAFALRSASAAAHAAADTSPASSFTSAS